MKISLPTPPHRAIAATIEGKRLDEADRGVPWRKWGPYLSERQWGTVREDYSDSGDAWGYLPHDHARSRAYRWGEDGLAGFSDDALALCLGLALWNGADPILKERLFGLTNAEGNHGEDVKELYYYLDGTPTHSYMRMLYKYPHAAFPYEQLLAENARRGLDAPEFELLDTGLFDHGRYFDVEVEYAKGAPDDILMRVRVSNRGDMAAEIHCLPQLWSRNTWAWSGGARPRLHASAASAVAVEHPTMPPMRLDCEGAPTLLFCENETNTRRLYGSGEGPFKDAFHDYVVGNVHDAVRAEGYGTKAAAYYRAVVPAHGEVVFRLRLRPASAARGFADFDATIQARRTECDEFYDALQSGILDPDARLVQRQAFAGMLWSKQYYGFDVAQWLAGDPHQPPPPSSRRHGRDAHWKHLAAGDILSMPDAWEYPWFASWDLAFHCITFALVDPAFAKAQLVLLTQSRFMHPKGQLPAYEWNFGDTNPPVHALAAMQIYDLDRARSGHADTEFLRRVFHKLTMNFTWWVNTEDDHGRSVFEGGFLGLDNISLFDRSAVLADGDSIAQADGTAWAAVYALNLMRIALELALVDRVYEDLAIKFYEHFLLIAAAMHRPLGDSVTGLWDDTDGFYYDMLEPRGAPRVPLRVRSMVGLIPLFAVEILESEVVARLPDFKARLDWLAVNRPELASLVSRVGDTNPNDDSLLALVRHQRMVRLLTRALDEGEFLSPYGLRSLSKVHAEHPASLVLNGETHTVVYAPGEGTTRLYGGNSNWRGPVWMPLNFLVLRALQRFDAFYGEKVRVEYPVGSGTMRSLGQVADDLADRLTRLFLRDAQGRRAIFGDNELSQSDPHFRDHVLFFEHFHGDNGRGLGASHQTGWTGLVALLLHERSEINTTLAGVGSVHDISTSTPDRKPS